MSAWHIFWALGWSLEMTGVGGVTILSPLFPKAVLNPPNGKVITIRAQNASREAMYVQSMELNGKPNSKLWLTVDQLTRGRDDKICHEPFFESDLGNGTVGRASVAGT